MKRILSFAAALLLALVALAGCSGGDDDGSEAGVGSTAAPAATTGPAATGDPAASIDDCAILTRAEIRGALGVPVRAGRPDLLGCEYRNPDFAAGGGSLAVMLDEPDDVRGCDLIVQPATDLPDIGDGAQFAQTQGGSYNMRVKVGGSCLFFAIAGIKLTDQGPAANLKRMRALASLAVPRVQAG